MENPIQVNKPELPYEWFDADGNLIEPPDIEKAEFDETKHPRAKNGEFGTGGVKAGLDSPSTRTQEKKPLKVNYEHKPIGDGWELQSKNPDHRSYRKIIRKPNNIRSASISHISGGEYVVMTHVMLPIPGKGQKGDAYLTYDSKEEAYKHANSFLDSQELPWVHKKFV